MNLCIGIAISSSLQIGLLVSPILVLTGWFIDVPMTFFFEVFETVILFASVMIVNYLIADGKSNWLEGALLLVSLILFTIYLFILKINSFFFFTGCLYHCCNGLLLPPHCLNNNINKAECAALMYLFICIRHPFSSKSALKVR